MKRWWRRETAADKRRAEELRASDEATARVLTQLADVCSEMIDDLNKLHARVDAS